MSDTNSLKKWAAILLPIPGLIPIFYIQGLATYEGSLAPYGISPGLYPINLEGALTRAFFFYAKAPPFFFWAGLFFLLLVPISVLDASSWAKKATDSKVWSWLAKAINKIEDFFEKHSAALIPSLICFGIGYLIFALALFVVIPYSVAKSEASSKLQDRVEVLESMKQPASELEPGLVRIHLKKGKFDEDGFVIASSPSLITVLTRSGVTTLQLAEVQKIESKIQAKKGKS